jgi:hypothetical protein
MLTHFLAASALCQGCKARTAEQARAWLVAAGEKRGWQHKRGYRPAGQHQQLLLRSPDRQVDAWYTLHPDGRAELGDLVLAVGRDHSISYLRLAPGADTWRLATFCALWPDMPTEAEVEDDFRGRLQANPDLLPSFLEFYHAAKRAHSILRHR